MVNSSLASNLSPYSEVALGSLATIPSRRFGEAGAAGVFQDSHGLLPRHALEAIQEFVERGALFEVLEQRAHRQPCVREAQRAAHALGILPHGQAGDGIAIFDHAASLAARRAE